MNSKFNTVIHTLTFASLGGAVVATKFFSDYSSPIALPLTITAVAFGIASVVGLIGVLRERDEEIASRDLDARFEDVWRNMDRIERTIDETDSRITSRLEKKAHFLSKK